MEETVIFIDGGFLSKLSKHFGNGNYIKFKIKDFVNNICKQYNYNCLKIYYYVRNRENHAFQGVVIPEHPKNKGLSNHALKGVVAHCFFDTAPPFQLNNPPKDQIKRKENYDTFKNTLIKEGIIFREGRCQRLKIGENFEFKQKGVDTLLTIDLSYIKEDYPNIKKVLLVSSDTDFCPVIENVIHRGIEVILFTFFDKKRGSPFSLSNHLLKSCSRWIKLTKENLENE